MSLSSMLSTSSKDSQQRANPGQQPTQTKVLYGSYSSHLITDLLMLKSNKLTSHGNFYNDDFDVVGVQETDGRRSLIGSLGAENHDDKLILYIPEKSLSGNSSTLGKSIRRNSVNIAEKKDEDSVSAGTKEGFDRFASIRRSRRYKKGMDLGSPTSCSSANPLSSATGISGNPGSGANSPTISPSKPEPFSSTASIRSRISSPMKTEPSRADSSTRTTLRSTGSGVPESSTSTITPTKPLRAPIRRRNDPRSMSTIEPRDVKLAMKHSSSSSSNESGVVSSQNGTSIVQIRHGGPSQRTFGNHGAKSSLNSSSGTAERDEGFEESHSSLSETNSQSEATNSHQQNQSNNLSTSHHAAGSAGGVEGRSLQRRPSRTSMTSLNKVASFRDSNSNVIGQQHYKNSSRQSLLSSRSSLTSQTTVGTVKENHNGGAGGGPSGGITRSISGGSNTSRSGGSRLADLDSTYSTHPSANSHADVSSRSSVGSNHSFSSRNGHATTTSNLLNGDRKSSGKSGGLGPRIFSFMKPTASSSAKDKLDMAKASAKGKPIKKTFK